MDNLRVLLMILGILIIAGIYFWGVGFDHRKAASKLTKRRKNLQEPVLDTPVIKPREEEIDYSDVYLRQGGLLRDEDADLPQDDSQSTVKPEPGVIVLHISPFSDYSFEGAMIRDALYAVGMTYGDRMIFNHHGVGQSVTKDSIFSVANIHEPGTFDLNNIEALQTNGLVMFMEIPAPIDTAVAFELMLSTAQRLAEMLKGQVRDEKREYLSPEAIEVFRSYVAGCKA